MASHRAVHRLRIDHTMLSIMARVEYCPTLLEGQCGVHGHHRISDTLPYLIIQKIPNVLYGRLVWRIGRPREDWDVFSFQKLYAYSGNIWLSIVLLDCRDVTEVIEWHIPAFSMTMARSPQDSGLVTSVAFRHLTNIDILGWPAIVPSIRSVRIVVTLC